MRAITIKGYSLADAPAGEVLKELLQLNMDELLSLKAIIEVVLRAKGDANDF